MILFFISLHHKTLPLLNKCAVSCWLSTVKKTRNGGSFKISLVHRMTSTNIKMYEVNLWQCNQSTWKSRKAQCAKYPENGSNIDFRRFVHLEQWKNHVLKDELANLKELTDWLSDPNSYCDLIIHLELALLFCDLPQGPEEHKPIKGSFFAAYDIFERIHLSLGTWPCISHKCCNFMNGNTNNLGNILCLIILILTMNSKMLQLHVSRQQHWAFFRGDILQLVAPGVEEMSTRESFNAKNVVAFILDSSWAWVLFESWQFSVRNLHAHFWWWLGMKMAQ